MIAIYSNSKIFGGVEILVYRFAEYLHARDIPFCVVEPAGTRLSNDLTWASVIAPSDIRIVAEKITHIFLPNVAKLRDPEFPWRQCRNAKMLAWVVHPNEPFRSFFPFSGRLLDFVGYRGVDWLKSLMPRHSALVELIFKKLCDGRALAVMDGATSRALNYFYPSLNCQSVIIPIPTTLSENMNWQRCHSEGVAVGYLGRLDRFKYSALAPFVEDHLRPLARRTTVELHVVAEGPLMHRLRVLCNRANVGLHEYGFQPNEAAKKIIYSQTKFAVAMGTSALDIASVGHPCIIIDPALARATISQSDFRFVHEIEQYTVGEYRDFPGYLRGLHSFEKTLELASVVETGEAGKDYVLTHHSHTSSFATVLCAIEASTLACHELLTLSSAMEESFLKVRRWSGVKQASYLLKGARW